MNTSDMHPFIHPLSAAVDPAWDSKSDWEIYKGIAKAFSEVCVGHLGRNRRGDPAYPARRPAELAQPYGVQDWKKGECDLIPGKTAPHIIAVERDYPATYERFTSLGPLLDKLGNGGKGISWNTQTEVDFLKQLNYVKADGPAAGRPKIESAIDAAEVILSLAPETNGQVAVKPGGPEQRHRPRSPPSGAEQGRREFASATFRRSRAKSSPARPGPVWKTNTFPTTPATPTCTS